MSLTNNTASIIKKRKVRDNPETFLIHTGIEDQIPLQPDEINNVDEEPEIDPEEERRIQEEEEQRKLNQMLNSEYEKGYEEGRNNAIKEFEDDFKNKLIDTIKYLSSLTSNIKTEFDDFKYSIDQEILKLSIAIAEKILSREVKLDEKIIVSQVSESIRKIVGVENIIIFVNPEDEKMLKLFKSDFYHHFESLKDITIQGHERINRGSCRIESNMGNVDARFSTQMKIIEEALLDKITENRANEDVLINED